MTIQKGDKVKLLRDITSITNISHKAGQTGTVTGILPSITREDVAIVDFDGYEVDKAKYEEAKRLYGELMINASWINCVPLSLLEVLAVDDAQGVTA